MNSTEKRTRFAQSLLAKRGAEEITQKEFQEGLLLHCKKERRDKLHHLLQLLDLSIPALQTLLRKEFNQEFSFDRIGRCLACPVRMTNEDSPDEVMAFLGDLSGRPLSH